MLSQRGQVTVEYALATALFMVIFVWFYQVIQDSLKNMFKSAALVILTSYK